MAEPWKVEGHYMEACNCKPACPCVFLSPPTEGDCTALVGWHIERGHYGDVKLDGLNTALMVHAPGVMHETQWKAALYLDDRADETQKNSLLQVFAGKAGGQPARLGSFIGQVLGVASVPIEYRMEGRQRSLRIGSVGEAAIRAIEGAASDEVTLNNHPLCIAPGFPAVVARSSRLRYEDHGYHWHLSDRNGLYSPFRYQA